MSIKLKDKICKQCNTEMIQVDASRLLCDTCRLENKQKSIDKQNKLQSERLLEKAWVNAKLNINLYTKENGKTLTPLGFDEVSIISYRNITQSLRGNSWIDILEKCGKLNNLKDYIKSEYNKSLQENKLITFSRFVKSHKYINQQFMRQFNTREFFEYLEIEYNRNNDDDDYKNNFINIKNKLGLLPLFHEFNEISKIKSNSYATKFGFKGVVYDNIVKMYSTEDEYIEYIKRKQVHKTNAGKLTANMNKTLVSKEELEIDLKRVFDEFYLIYKKYPSIRLFQKLSNRDKRTYEEKFNKKFKDVCLDFGYDIEDKASAEYIVLHKISNILNTSYEPQKTWKWLKGIKNFPLWVDGYFSKYNLAIEFDGRQHQEPVLNFGGEKAFETLQQNDKIKNKLIPEHGIKLIRISSFEDWFNEEYLKEVLFNNEILLLA